MIRHDLCNRDPHSSAGARGERALASIERLAEDSAYMADLEGEIEATTRAYVGAAVTEIATLRAELSGPQVG
jgi:hypothetical protein